MTRAVDDPGLLFGHPVRHPNECPVCKTFRKDGEPPTSHRFFCSEYVDQGVIRILDLMFVRRDSDGSMRAVELADIDADGQFDLAVFAGASSGMLDDSDLAA